MQKNDFSSFNELRKTFPTADKVGDLIVFNISGNKFRLITSIHFNRNKVYIRHVLTHPEYKQMRIQTLKNEIVFNPHLLKQSTASSTHCSKDFNR